MAQFTQRIQNNWENGFWAGSWEAGDSLYSSFGIGKNYYGQHNYCGLRFTNVNIPKGSTITSAYLTLVDEENKTVDVNFKLFGLDEDNTSDFHSDPSSREKTTAYVTWHLVNQTTDSTRVSSDIKSIIQEIIDRSGWSSGNSIGFTTEDNGTSNDNILRFWSYYGSSSKAAYLEINYSPPAHLITKDLTYKVSVPQTAVTKMLRYSILDQELEPVPFFGIKIAKDTHNVLNTKDPNNLKFSSDYNTLKYNISGHKSLHVTVSGYVEYRTVAYVEHNLGYYPFSIVYAKDDLMANYQPLGHWQAGSGAYRQFYYYVTTTRLYVVAKGWSEVDESYDVDFYYKIFKNNLNL